MSVDAAFVKFGRRSNRRLLCLLIVLASSNVIECCKHAILLGTSLNIVVFFWQNPHISASQLRRQEQSILSNKERHQATEFMNVYKNSKIKHRHSAESTSKKRDHTNTRKTSYYDTDLIEPRIINGNSVRPGRFPFYSFPVGNWLCG